MSVSSSSSSSSSTSASRVDPCSFANVNEAAVTHFHLDLRVSFETSTINGSVLLSVVSRISGVKHLVLDSNNLTFFSVTNQADNRPLHFTVGAAHPVFGRPVTITLPDEAAVQGHQTRILISFQTSPSSSACQWLPVAQTAGKKFPFMFTQCQAIHARSLIPIQDTPAIKCTYTASIRVSRPLTALMSAIRVGSQESSDGELMTFMFEQSVPIPSYLLALAVGHLESRTLGPRSAVWSEPETVEAAAYEFQNTDLFLTTAEQICGPYVWKQYDLLLLPPSFPYGGMENPCLTFVTPTLLAGDRSLVNVVAHEIAHSWTGNLVGCHTWESFWLNEGWTVFVERKIGQKLYGKAAAHLDAVSGWRHLQESVGHYGEHHPFTCLHCNLTDTDPDDAFSSVPYEKGFNFLFYLEQLVSEQLFDQFVPKYIANFAYKTCTSEQFKQFFLDYFNNKLDAAEKHKLQQIDWDTWFHKPGMPVVPPAFDRSLVTAAVELGQRIADGQHDPIPADIQGWHTNQRIVLLEKLLEHANTASSSSLSSLSSTMLKVDGAFGLTVSGNAEIKFRWSQIAIRVGLFRSQPEISKAIIHFLTSQGRMKFVRPLYRDLFSLGGDDGKTLAVQTFKQHRTNYHGIAQKMIAKDLQIAE